MERSSISINLDHIKKDLRLHIDAMREHTLFEVADHHEYNEARYQLVEGCRYDYELNDADYTFEKSQVIIPRKRTPNCGTIATNIYVGTLSLPLLYQNSEIGEEIALEVQSIKTTYREDYRQMLEYITEKCTDLLMQSNSPTIQHYETDYTDTSNTLYQRFSFVKSVILTNEFSEAIHRILTVPATQSSTRDDIKDIRRIRRFDNKALKAFGRGGNRIKLPTDHIFIKKGVYTVPKNVATSQHIDSVDTPENRFIKHALATFLKFCTDIQHIAKPNSRLQKEAIQVVNTLESYLNHAIFKNISRPTSLKINSPVLQRKEGYREILRVWLMFDLAAKLIWKGGNDVYSAGQKNIANLYEYWLFFKLLDLFSSIFDIESKQLTDLIKSTKDGLHLEIKQGTHTALNGIYKTETRELNIRFNYNRSFKGQNTYPRAGSWTAAMRPDYTLSFWPKGIDETTAEEQELIVHIHFDAKYKIKNFREVLEKKTDEYLNKEKKDHKQGIYQNVDLLKMHAYKDAIRRTGGAYILYPGDISSKQKGFHEIIPGLGAFPIRPSKTDSGIVELKSFIYEVIDHFMNRASQRERIAYKTYDVHRETPSESLKVKMPEPHGYNRSLLPDETYVVIGYSKQDQWKWIQKTNLYNFRTGDRNGAIHIDANFLNATFILAHVGMDAKTLKLFRIVSKGGKVLTKKQLIAKDYPSKSSATNETYLVYDIIETEEFTEHSWDIHKLIKNKGIQNKYSPFVVTLTELMKSKL